MRRETGFSLPLQLLLWACANSAAGAAVGLAVGVFREGGLHPTIVVVSVLFGNVVGFTVLVATITLSPRLRAVGPALRAVLLGLALLSGGVAGTALVLYLFPLFVLRDVRQAFAVAAINGVLALIVGGVVHAYEGLRWRLAESLREVEEVRLVEARLREEAARAELAALQARINPHFFFNTLNTIASLLEEDPDRAEELVQTLADLFRYTFKAAEEGPVLLAEELDFVRHYLVIERARFGDRLRVVWDVESTAGSAPVPGLILQPLVENAVGHGIAPVSGGGTVRISAHLSNGALWVEVGDDGSGLRGTQENVIRDGHGLGNVRRRLHTLYGDAGTIEVLPSASGRGTIARLRVPVGGSVAGGAGGS
jgi:histidine kinase/histidine kinase/DNA gyrase B/HSP90-like ATPase